MRLLLLAAAFIAPCCVDSFALQHRGPVGASSVRATSSSHRCCSSTVMTLPSALNRLAGTVLLGGALLTTGVVTGAEIARADVSISPRCESMCFVPFWDAGKIGDRTADSCQHIAMSCVMFFTTLVPSCPMNRITAVDFRIHNFRRLMMVLRGSPQNWPSGAR